MPRPNILFFFPDQHRPDWLGMTSGLPLRTPNIDRLAAEGIHFTNAITPSPLCAPARACLASGRQYDDCRVPDNGVDYPLDLPTYYQRLRDAGYRVAGVGKFDLHKDVSDPTRLDWHLDGSRLLTEWGFTEGIDNEGKFDGSTSYRVNGKPCGPYLAYLQSLGLADTYVREHAEIKKNMGAYTTALPDDAYCDNWLSENGLRFLRNFPKNQPWHLVINFTGPHNPMDVTASMRRRWENVAFPPPTANDQPDREGILRNRQNYAAMIENIDRQVGRFIDVVRERGDLDNTLIIYASDHGEMLGDHGRWGKSIWRWPSTGIPLIVKSPGTTGGRSCPALVCLHDLAATFLDYAGCDELPDMDSCSLRPLIEGSCERTRPAVTSGLHDWRLARNETHELILEKGTGPRLFNLQDDPWEEYNIASSHPGIVQELTDYMRTSGVTLPR